MGDVGARADGPHGRVGPRRPEPPAARRRTGPAGAASVVGRGRRRTGAAGGPRPPRAHWCPPRHARGPDWLPCPGRGPGSSEARASPAPCPEHAAAGPAALKRKPRGASGSGPRPRADAGGHLSALPRRPLFPRPWLLRSPTPEAPAETLRLSSVASPGVRP